MSNVDGTDPTADPVELLVGEGKKYKTVQDLAKSRMHADEYIKQIEAENAGLREVVKASATKSRADDFDTFMAELRGQSKQTPVEPKAAATTPNQPALTEDVLEKLLEARERKRGQEAAVSTVKQEIAKVYGEKADEVYSKALKDSGLTEEIVKALAFTSPQTAIRALNIPSAAPGQSGISPSVDSGAFFGSKPEARDYAYYKELEKKIGSTEFYNPKVQKQLMQDRINLGDKFWG